MIYDFDTPVERRGSNCIKFDFPEKYGGTKESLPLWVADMDFQVAPSITQALGRMVDHGIYGYSDTGEDYVRAVLGWYERHFSWKAKAQWLVKTPGVVFALATAVRAYTKPGEAVMLCRPVYYPFTRVVEANGRRVVNSSLVETEEGYRMDFEDIERKLQTEGVKLFLLCSPHNPVSRVWTSEELLTLGELCRREGVILVSDEIHSDFVWEGHTHHPFLSLSPEFEDFSLVCTAPSKSFNTAGLQCSNIFIPNQELRKRFTEAMEAVGVGSPSLPGLLATQAAYEGGEEWLSQVKAYIFQNITFMDSFLKERLPELKMTPAQGTYLTWVDFRALGLSEEERQELILRKAALWLDRGSLFGEEGKGFERFNLACPRSTLNQALEQLERALRA